MAITYNIDTDTFAITFFDGINPEPFQFQPDYPNGDKFDSYEEAQSWAEAAKAAHDPSVLYFAPDGKNLPPRKKLTEAEKTTNALLAAGINPEELKKLLGL